MAYDTALDLDGNHVINAADLTAFDAIPSNEKTAPRATAVSMDWAASGHRPLLVSLPRVPLAITSLDDTAKWDKIGGSWQMKNNRFIQTNSSVEGSLSRALLNTATPVNSDFDFKGTLQFDGSDGRQAGMIFRYQDSKNYAWVKIDGQAGNLSVYQVLNGVETLVASNSLGKQLLYGHEHTFSIQARDNIFDIYFDGVLDQHLKMTAIPANGKVGLLTN